MEYLNEELICYRKKFSSEEDEIIKLIFLNNENKKFEDYSSLLKGRSKRQCKERFNNYLNPNLKELIWTIDDDLKLLDKINQFGNKWSLISEYFPGRSINNIKNRWFKHLKKNYKKFYKDSYKIIENVLDKNPSILKFIDEFDESLIQFNVK